MSLGSGLENFIPRDGILLSLGSGLENPIPRFPDTFPDNDERMKNDRGKMDLRLIAGNLSANKV